MQKYCLHLCYICTHLYVFTNLCLLRKFEENLLKFGLSTWGNLSSMVEIIQGSEGDGGAGAMKERERGRSPERPDTLVKFSVIIINLDYVIYRKMINLGYVIYQKIDKRSSPKVSGCPRVPVLYPLRCDQRCQRRFTPKRWPALRILVIIPLNFALCKHPTHENQHLEVAFIQRINKAIQTKTTRLRMFLNSS